jgi:hypothetical protein
MSLSRAITTSHVQIIFRPFGKGSPFHRRQYDILVLENFISNLTFALLKKVVFKRNCIRFIQVINRMLLCERFPSIYEHCETVRWEKEHDLSGKEMPSLPLYLVAYGGETCCFVDQLQAREAREVDKDP